MSKNDEEFLERLLATFRVEADEHIKAITTGLIDLEKSDASDRRKEIIEIVFREAHSLKGAARAVNLADIETICQSIESVFASLKRGEVALSPDSFDALHRAVDAAARLLESDEPGPRVTRLAADLDSIISSSPAEARHAAEPIAPIEEKPRLVDTVRIATAKLDSLLLQAEEMLSARQTALERVADMREINQSLADWKRELTRIAPDARAISRSIEQSAQIKHRRKDDPRVVKLLSFVDQSGTFFKSLEGRLSTLIRAAEADSHLLGGRTENLLEDMKKALMLPFSSLLEMLPKMARDLSRDQGKEARVIVRGEEIEIDRRILEEIKDPLIHLLRNSIDHGIEPPPERERKGKSRQGTILVAVSPKDGGKVELTISDDGCGVDIQKVKDAAIRLGALSREEAETSDESYIASHIFRSGLSTSPLITDISGRGLGLAIVMEKVERLGGRVAFQTVRDRGVSFTITLPVMLSTFRGVIVRAASALFVFPTSSVERVVRFRSEDIRTVENRETARLNGELVSIVRLSDALGLAARSEPDARDRLQAVIIAGDRRIAFAVDEVLREQDVLVKGLGRQLARVPNIAGATILGSGEVVPILNVADLVKSAARSAGVARREAIREEEKDKKSVLVVEDSITARTLVAGILESSGYKVTTAFDGIDGLTKLRSGNFDLVVSDVDMPRMNGFDLTAKIRGDRRLVDLPVVLVTALASREDQERGMEAGANAYIVKSDFDQSNLLEVIKRLI